MQPSQPPKGILSPDSTLRAVSPCPGHGQHSVLFEDGLSRQSWLWLAITDLWGNVFLIEGCEYIRGRIVIVIIVFSPPFEKGRPIKGFSVPAELVLPLQEMTLDFSEDESRCGEERETEWQSSVAAFWIPPSFPTAHFAPEFVLNPRCCLQCSSQAWCSWGPTAGRVFGKGDCSAWSNKCSAETCLGQQLQVMNDRFLSPLGQSDSSSLMFSLGEPPGDGQEDHATTFSLGMASASPVVLHQRNWSLLQTFN